ncbi:MAG: single-stranded DNA-binding protein [Planctomycetes bacterium]|nr:single-stranded DNA-binding protein [Planctomycetota bacterium]
MASFNKVILLGGLTRDPQLSYLPSQTAVVEFGLRIDRKFRRQDGEQGTESCFVDCQMFGKRAEVINKYLKKGNALFVEGRLKFDSWESQVDGKVVKRSKLRVNVENFEFIGGGKRNDGGGGNRSQGGGGDYNSGQGGQGGGGQGGPGPVADDDIPF